LKDPHFLKIGVRREREKVNQLKINAILPEFFDVTWLHLNDATLHS